MRLVRPGAILLANLDADEDTNVLAPRTRFATNAGDWTDNTINFSPDDDQDVTHIVIAEPPMVLGNATRVSLRIDVSDQERVRMFRVSPTAAPNLQGGPPDVVEVIDPGAAQEYEVGNTQQGAPGGMIVWQPPWVPGAGWQERFVVEALTLPGDPFDLPAGPRYLPVGGIVVPAPAAIPHAPGVFRTPAAATTGGSEASPRVNATNTANPAYPAHPQYGNRAPGDVWVEVIHETGVVAVASPVGAGQANLNDLALFTIAPWIMTWNTLPVERLYVCYTIGAARPPAFETSLTENHPMVFELHEALHAAGLEPTLPPVNTSTLYGIPPARLAPGVLPVGVPDLIRARNDMPYYIIPPSHIIDPGSGAVVPGWVPAGSHASDHGGDRWIQDEIEIGYCWRRTTGCTWCSTFRAPHRTRNWRGLRPTSWPIRGWACSRAWRRQWVGGGWGRIAGAIWRCPRRCRRPRPRWRGICAPAPR